MRKILLLTLLGASFWMLSSCSQQYDLETVEKTITVGGDNFVFPLGLTNRMIVDSILDISGIDELKRADDGSFYFDYSGSLEKAIDLTTVANKIQIPAVTKSITPVTVTPVPWTLPSEPYSFPISLNSQKISVDYDFSGAISEGLKRLDSVEFEKSKIMVTGTVKLAGSAFPEGYKLKAKLTLPNRFNYDQSVVVNDTLESETIIDKGNVSFEPVYFNVGKFSDAPGVYKYADSIVFKELTVTVPNQAAYNVLVGKEVKVELSVKLSGDAQETIKPKILYCLLDTKIDTVAELIPITGIPDYMRDSVLDLSHPMIRMNVKSNSTVPVKVGSRFISFNSGKFTLASTSVDLKVESVAPTPQDSSATNFVIANEQPTGGEYVYAYADIDTLVHTMPTSLTVKLAPGTYIKPDSAESQHKIYVNSTTGVKMNYNLTLPLQFGSKLNMSFRDTISGMPEELGNIMEKNDVSLVGTALSTLPVKLSYEVRMLDSDGKDLGIKSTTKGVIERTDNPTTPVQSEYSVDMKASSNAKKISKMEVIFYMTEGNGQCLNKDNWVQMDFQVSVPGGIDIDLD